MTQGRHSSDLVDLVEALGVTGGTSVDVLTLWIPDRNCEGAEIGDQRRWILKGADLLSRIGGGVTIMPPAEGGWVDPDGRIIWERPVLIYTYVIPGRLRQHIGELRRFIHRMGRETKQGELAIEFNGKFHRLIHFDPHDGQDGTA